ncbi:MAG: transcription-repair coupling factor [Bacteriovoracaceae bacterium]
MLFEGLRSKLSLWQQEQKKLKILGVTPSQWGLISSAFFKDLVYDKPQLMVCSSVDEAEEIYELLKGRGDVLIYPGHDYPLYSSVISSEAALLQRFKVLGHLLEKPNHPWIIVTTLEASLLKGPDHEFFKAGRLVLKKEDIISPINLAMKLTELGYFSTSSVEEPGTFCRRGEIFDIYPVSHPPIRLQYFDDMIEEIFAIDQETQKTNREVKFEEMTLDPAPGQLVKEPFSTELRSKLPQAQPQFKNKFERRKEILSRIAEGQLFENYSLFVPLFFKNPKTIWDFISTDSKLTFINGDKAQNDFEFFTNQNLEDYERELDEPETKNVLPSPDHFYLSKIPDYKNKSLHIDTLDISVDLEDDLKSDIHLHLHKLKTTIATKMQNTEGGIPENKYDYIKKFLRTIKHELSRGGHLIVVYRHENSRQEIQYLLEENKLTELNDRIKFVPGKIEEGFHYASENIYLICEGDFFSAKKKKTQKVASTNKDLFAEQLSTLKVNDYVIHRDHGVGIYKGLETIKVGDQESDFLVIVYEDNDKVYVPVYKLNLVQKHAESNSGMKVASLKSKKFAELKTRVRSSVKALAFDLLKLQAERKLKGGFPFSPPDHLFKEFELSFPFEETPDQEKAINDVIEDMQNQYPMERLVCGDVGFGKTEVAMRAAFKAVLDKKQVVILVPTTVLALQHFHSFKKRFSQFPVNVEMLSRFKTPKEKKEVISVIAEGKVDIVVGTHAILSDKIEFQDLGLLIIDEEHRFGVAHKEKLKVLKAGVDVLTMTATPIPRTMQLSFLGIRDLSLIQTAPPRRQSIKTYIIKEDDLTLKTAMEKELGRGGQIYFVHNRVHDIEEFEIYLKKLVPQARISVAHGQMGERELEKKINDFYNHRSDILLATTIIESGIDIPNANTMIIDRADTYGLAQLHQLRGRIGRSDRKAYAYFIVPDNRVLSETAQRRLHALQTYADMGSGFALASSDLEIRGAGDILGGEQSGHIEGIGLELYMDLLQEAIQELRGEERVSVKNIEIQAPFTAYIPNSYIPDHGLRLKYYKRLSNTNEKKNLEKIIEEMTDVFGMTPKELDALYNILRTRIEIQPLGIRVVKVSGSTIYLYFDQDILGKRTEIRDKMLSHFMSKPKLYKLAPDSSVACYFKEPVSHQMLLEFSKHIAQQIGVC